MSHSKKSFFFSVMVGVVLAMCCAMLASHGKRVAPPTPSVRAEPMPTFPVGTSVAFENVIMLGAPGICASFNRDPASHIGQIDGWKQPPLAAKGETLLSDVLFCIMNGTLFTCHVAPASVKGTYDTTCDFDITLALPLDNHAVLHRIKELLDKLR